MKLNIYFFVPTRNIFKLNLKVYNINCNLQIIIFGKAFIFYISNRFKRMFNFCCCTINVMYETHILEPKNVGLFTWRVGEGGLKKCSVCTFMKMLTFLDDPLVYLYTWPAYVVVQLSSALFNMLCHTASHFSCPSRFYLILFAT